MRGSLEVITGSMFSGKTHELIRRLRLCTLAKKRVQVFKSYKDDRYNAEALVSHDGFQLASHAVREAAEILELVEPNCSVIGVDEAQFFDNQLVQVCENLANRGLRVIVAGLDLDYRGQPFEVMAQFLARAESVTKNLAICCVCGENAHYTQRIRHLSDERVLVGAADIYEARCRQCFVPPSPDDGRDPADSVIAAIAGGPPATTTAP